MGPEYRVTEYDDSVLQVIAAKHAKHFNGGTDEGLEFTINCLKRAMQDGDGFQAAKTLEGDGFDVDAQTVDDLENMIHDRYHEAREQTKAKIVAMGLKPKYAAGQRVVYRRGRYDKPEEGVINKVVSELLEYYLPGVTDNSQWIIKEEDILHACS